MAKRDLESLPAAGSPCELFCHLHVREDALELYGFVSEQELEFFELLISVSGVGPKSALAVLDVARLEELAAAIREGRPDLLTRASGIGRKTGERIVIELKTRVTADRSEQAVKKMEADADLVEAIAGLGYRRERAKTALEKVDAKILDAGERIKAALKTLNKKQ